MPPLPNVTAACSAGLNIASWVLQKPGNVEALPIPSGTGMISPSLLPTLKTPFLIEMTSTPFSGVIARSSAFLLDGMGFCRSSAARSHAGIRVRTTASCLLLADCVQQFIDVARALLVAIAADTAPISDLSGTNKARFAAWFLVALSSSVIGVVIGEQIVAELTLVARRLLRPSA